MSANSGWKAKMANFQERFKSMLGAKAQVSCAGSPDRRGLTTQARRGPGAVP